MATVQVVSGVRYPFTAEYKMAISCMREEIVKARKSVLKVQEKRDAVSRNQG
jgi:hypothetical protein